MVDYSAAVSPIFYVIDNFLLVFYVFGFVGRVEILHRLISITIIKKTVFSTSSYVLKLPRVYIGQLRQCNLQLALPVVVRLRVKIVKKVSVVGIVTSIHTANLSIVSGVTAMIVHETHLPN